MAVPIVDPVRVRPAGSLGLLTEDIAALRDFQSIRGVPTWFEKEAQRMVRRAASALSAGTLGPREQVLLVERDGILHAISVFTEESASTAHLVFLGLESSLHGARIDSEDGDRLSDATLAASLVR